MASSGVRVGIRVGRRSLVRRVLGVWPVSARLFATGVIGVACTLSVALLGAWSVLALRGATSELERLTRAASTLEAADMQHDAVLSKTYAVLLDPSHRGQRRSELDAEVRAYDRSLSEVLTLPLPENLRTAVRELDRAHGLYVTEALRVAADAPTAGNTPTALIRPLDESFTSLRSLHARVNLLFADAIVGRRSEADASAGRGLVWLATVCALAGGLLLFVIVRLTSKLPGALDRVYLGAKAMAEGNLDTRIAVQDRDEVGAIADVVNQMAERLQATIERLQAEQDRDAYGRQVTDAMDVADSGTELDVVVARAMQALSTGLRMELLLAPHDNASVLERAAEHPSCGAAGCGVPSLTECVAARRGQPVRFDPAHGVLTCRYLENRAIDAPYESACVPLLFMGRTLGVLSTTELTPGELNKVLPKVTLLGQVTGSRVGALRAAARTRAEADSDALTGLMNRRALEEQVGRFGATTRYAVIMSDLDGFKALNDNYGHDVGDRALRVYANVIRRSLREVDLAARWGGEEFIAVLQNHTALSAFEIAERIRRNLSVACQIDGPVPFTASFGVADSTMGIRFDHLVRIADDALYQSKAGGRDRVTVGEPAKMDGRTPTRLTQYILPHADVVSSDGELELERQSGERRDEQESRQ